MPGVPEFRFLTDHGNALLLIMRDPRIRVREIADLLDISERDALGVVTDLFETGYIEVVNDEGRNIFSIKTDLPLHLPFQRDADIRALLGLLREHND